MKVIFFCSYYDVYLNIFYKKNPGLSNLSYTQQMLALKQDHFGHWASYADEFVKLGIEAELIIPNCKPLQLAWARENNVKFDQGEWNFSIALEQVKKLKPDIFYISSMFEYYKGFLGEVKKYTRKIFSWINCPVPSDLQLTHVDFLLTSVPYMADNFRKAGVPTEVMGSAFDPAILHALGNETIQDIPFSFVGSLTPAHTYRIELIKKLMDNTKLDFFGTGIKHIPDERSFFKKIFSKNIYEQRVHPSVWGLEMYRTLQRSKITFNAHIDMSKNIIGNMRMYEATGVGTLVLTDGKHATHKKFSDDEVVYYDTVEDAIEKANYYLQHENERAVIARRGQQKTLTEYNYQISSQTLLRYFNQYMKMN
jgi:spore maturation protein CgeB